MSIMMTSGVIMKHNTDTVEMPPLGDTKRYYFRANDGRNFITHLDIICHSSLHGEIKYQIYNANETGDGEIFYCKSNEGSFELIFDFGDTVYQSASGIVRKEFGGWDNRICFGDDNEFYHDEIYEMMRILKEKIAPLCESIIEDCDE